MITSLKHQSIPRDFEEESRFIAMKSFELPNSTPKKDLSPETKKHSYKNSETEYQKLES